MHSFAFNRVLITGGAGFLGSALRRVLLKRNVPEIISLSSQDADLRDIAQTNALVARYRPDCIIHAAVQGGGIGWMREHPVESGVDNLRMNINILDAAAQNNVGLFIGVSSACVYPGTCREPYREDGVWNGYPEKLNGGYALSKRMMMDMGRAYAQQYGLHSVFPVLANLYGEGDHLNSERAHVVADLMIRCSSDPKELVVWGTGIARREFLYVEDAAEGILACARAPSAEIINIGTGIETPIVDLARSIIIAHGLDTTIRFDSDKPDGQIRKVMDVSKARTLLGWSAPTSLQEGLRKTAIWYRHALGVDQPS